MELTPELVSLRQLLNNDDESTIRLGILLAKGMQVPFALFPDLTNTNFKKLLCLEADFIDPLKLITDLHLNSLAIEALPDSIGQLPQLKTLLVYSNELQHLPANLQVFKNLTRLHVDSNRLKSLKGIEKLRNLRHLYAHFNRLTDVEHIGFLSHLRSLHLHKNYIQELPASFEHLSQLQVCNLSQNQLIRLPDFIGQWFAMEELNLDTNQIFEVSPKIGQLQKLQKLHLSRKLFLKQSPNSTI